MQEHINMVADFHRKHRFPIGLSPGDDPKTDLVRVHLIAEELGELAEGLANKDLEKVADSIGDLLYVVFGAALSYGIPLVAIFEEIQRANMLKAVRQEGDTRLRNKGDLWKPPDILGILKQTGRIQCE
jgi:NTP pyrophosphatase (non-canonical NTP hydrolase)